MFSKHKGTLFSVRLLMLCSQLALTAFVGYWLFGQYEKEKERLAIDVSNTITDINRNLSDSLLMSKLIAGAGKKNYAGGTRPTVVMKSKFTTKDTLTKLDINKLIPDGKHLNNSVIAYEIHTTENSKGTVNDVQQMQMSIDTDSISIPDTGKIINAIVGILAGANDAIKGKGLGLLNTDTITLRKNFADKAKQNNWRFETIWIYDNIDSKKVKKGMLVSGKYMNSNAGVIVKGYFWDIVKKIAPQVFFGILLVSLAGISFIVAFRSLKKQTQHAAIMKDFISNMSHELKTPISTVKVALEALDNFNAIEDKHTTKEYLAMAGAEINRLDMLVNKALHNTLIEDGAIVLRTEPVNLQSLTEDTVGLFRLRAEQQGADITTHFEDGNYTIAGDAAHLQGVLVNIIDNSLKYADKKLSIAVNGKRNDKEIEIAITDNGPGIAADYIEKVFDRFFRVPVGDTHNVKGYGLGLHYARQIVARHGGYISVHNNKPSGCTFTITLPVA